MLTGTLVNIAAIGVGTLVRRGAGGATARRPRFSQGSKQAVTRTGSGRWRRRSRAV